MSTLRRQPLSSSQKGAGNEHAETQPDSLYLPVALTGFIILSVFLFVALFLFKIKLYLLFIYPRLKLSHITLCEGKVWRMTQNRVLMTKRPFKKHFETLTETPVSKRCQLTGKHGETCPSLVCFCAPKGKGRSVQLFHISIAALNLLFNFY